MIPRIEVHMTNVRATAALEALLAIESFAERHYSDRAGDPHKQRRYNDLAEIVLPLREAMDQAWQRPAR